MRRFNLAMLALLLMAGVPYYWFFLDNSGPKAAPRPVTISQLRVLAGHPASARPLRIRYELVAWDRQMGNRIAAGTGLHPVQLGTIAYLLEYAHQPPVLIGSGITGSASARHGQDRFYASAQARVTAALADAAALAPLTSADDQLGGLRMLGATGQAAALAEGLERQHSLDREGLPYRVAPGVVVIPTADLHSGSRMVYVRLASGHERLFAGSLSPIEQNWSELRLPARFTTDIGVLQDRGVIRSWLLTVRSLKRAAPGLRIIGGNRLPDGGGIARYFFEIVEP